MRSSSHDDAGLHSRRRSTSTKRRRVPRLAELQLRQRDADLALVLAALVLVRHLGLFLAAEEEPEVSYKDKGGKYQSQVGVTLPKL